MAVEVDYELQLFSSLKPETGELEDMCESDLYVLTNASQLWVVNAVINAVNPCIDIDSYLQSNNEGSRAREVNGVNYDFESNTEICNGVLSYTGQDTSYTETMEAFTEFWAEMVYYYNVSEEDMAIEFDSLYQNAVDFGKIVSETETTVTIREVDRFGVETITTYSKETYLELQVVTTDPNGDQNIQIFNYTCSDDGEIVPQSITSISQEISPMCKDKYTRTEIQQFNNYQITR